MEKTKADALITEYLPKLYGFAVSRSFYYQEADELGSDLVSAVYLSLMAQNDIENVDGYIWRICERTYAKFVARKKRNASVPIDGLDFADDPEEDIGEREERQQRLRLLSREIAYLTQMRRRIVYSFYYENKKISALSRELGIPEGTVKWHLKQARDDIKKGVNMERKIGSLGLNPVRATNMGHSGHPGTKGGPECYLNSVLALNIVYSVYIEPKTINEISEELGVIPVFLEDYVQYLENNGFLVRQSGARYTTYVKFAPRSYSIEKQEKVDRKRLEIAKILVKDYVPRVIKALADVKDIYIPSGNRQLFEAAAVFYGVSNKCSIVINRDLSKYNIKTQDGGNYVAFVELDMTCRDPEYQRTLNLPNYWACGDMTRDTDKYPVAAWAIDSRLSSREGGWQNNLWRDYEYVYEVMTGMIEDTSTNADKFKRLRERRFITENGKVNIMVAKGKMAELWNKIPELDEQTKKIFADFALEVAMARAKEYPPQMQDLIMSWEAGNFIGNRVALMVLDILYANGTFKPLTEDERVTANLIMFADRLPNK